MRTGMGGTVGQLGRCLPLQSQQRRSSVDPPSLCRTSLILEFRSAERIYNALGKEGWWILTSLLDAFPCFCLVALDGCCGRILFSMHEAEGLITYLFRGAAIGCNQGLLLLNLFESVHEDWHFKALHFPVCLDKPGWKLCFIVTVGQWCWLLLLGTRGFLRILGGRAGDRASIIPIIIYLWTSPTRLLPTTSVDSITSINLPTLILTCRWPPQKRCFSWSHTSYHYKCGLNYIN